MTEYDYDNEIDKTNEENKPKGYRMDSIYLWTWTTTNEREHTTSTVGSSDYRDQLAYLQEGKSEGWIIDYKVEYDGEDT